MRPGACVVLVLARCLYGAEQVNVDADFDAMLAKVHAAQVEFARGRPGRVQALWSHEDDVTLTRRVRPAPVCGEDGTETTQFFTKETAATLAYYKDKLGFLCIGT